MGVEKTLSYFLLKVSRYDIPTRCFTGIDSNFYILLASMDGLFWHNVHCVHSDNDTRLSWELYIPCNKGRRKICYRQIRLKNDKKTFNNLCQSEKYNFEP